jgi:CobQ-like glutamine amidotransferase family enzyme
MTPVTNTTKLTQNESEALKTTAKKLCELRDFLDSYPLDEKLDLRRLKTAVEQIQEIQGNLSNDGSLIACVLARQFLQRRFEIPAFDAAAKPQGAPGLDVDVLTSSQKRIIGEIKTTVPYERNRRDLGANQKATFIKDFEKLEGKEAHHKFFFVTNPLTHEVVSERYGNRLRDGNIELILLGGGEETLIKS